MILTYFFLFLICFTYWWEIILVSNVMILFHIFYSFRVKKGWKTLPDLGSVIIFNCYIHWVINEQISKWRRTCRLTTLTACFTSGLWPLKFSCDLRLGFVRWRISPSLLQYPISIHLAEHKYSNSLTVQQIKCELHLAYLCTGACISATCTMLPTVISAFKSLSFISREVTFILQEGNTLFPLT